MKTISAKEALRRVIWMYHHAKETRDKTELTKCRNMLRVVWPYRNNKTIRIPAP